MNLPPPTLWCGWRRVEGKSEVNLPYKCHLKEVAFVWELTKETIHLPLGCLQGGVREFSREFSIDNQVARVRCTTGVILRAGLVLWGSFESPLPGSLIPTGVPRS